MRKMLLVVLFSICVSYSFTIRADTEHSSSVVRITVSGTAIGPCSVPRQTGTAFFVNRLGYALTAAHVVLPKNCSNVKWEDKNPTIKVELAKQSLTAVIIYSDIQTDLALIKVDIGADTVVDPIPIGSYSDLINTKLANAIVFGPSRDGPLERSGTVDTAVSINSNGRAAIDFTSVEEGDSGSPILNGAGVVVAILSVGDWKRKTGKVAVPISFAHPMLMHIETRSRKEDERRQLISAVIDELKTDAGNIAVNLTKDGRLHLTFDKRLDDGDYPAMIRVNALINGPDDESSDAGSFVVDKYDRYDTKFQEAYVNAFSGNIEEHISELTQRGPAKYRDWKLDTIKSIVLTPELIFHQYISGNKQEKSVFGLSKVVPVIYDRQSQLIRSR